MIVDQFNKNLCFKVLFNYIVHIKCGNFLIAKNTDSVLGRLSFPAVQPHGQLVLQLQQSEVCLWVLVTEEEDDLQPLQQMLHILLRTCVSCVGQVLLNQTGKGN